MANEEFKAAFLTAIRAGGTERERAFSFFETKLADSFKGEAGLQFFDDLLALVKEADESALPAARDRFFPLIDQKLFSKKALAAFSEALDTTVQRQEADLEFKEVLATFLEGADGLDDARLFPFVAHRLETMRPELRVRLVVFLFRLVTTKHKGG